jgi:hypothetical protein
MITFVNGIHKLRLWIQRRPATENYRRPASKALEAMSSVWKAGDLAVGDRRACRNSDWLWEPIRRCVLWVPSPSQQRAYYAIPQPDATMRCSNVQQLREFGVSQHRSTRPRWSVRPSAKCSFDFDGRGITCLTMTPFLQKKVRCKYHQSQCPLLFNTHQGVSPCIR